MYCLQCHYNLRELPENRCPECGRRFDPNDPESYDPDPMRRFDAYRIVAIVAAYPLIVLAAVFLTWCVSWISLGHAPRVGADDPKHINGIVSFFHGVTSMMLLLLTLHLPGAPIIICAFAYADRANRMMGDRSATLFLICVGSWFSLFAVSFASPIMSWFVD